MGIRTGILVLAALTTAACHRDLRPTEVEGRWEVACLMAADQAPELLADYADWRSVAEAAERIDGGWRLRFRPPPATMFRVQCRSGDQAVAPSGFEWVEDDGFGGQNAVGFAGPSDPGGARPLE